MQIPFLSRWLRPELTALHYDDIPVHADPSLVNASYPQQLLSAIEMRPLSFFRDRYAKELRDALTVLPLAKADIERFVMPTLTRSIGVMHLLPASETHHHSGAGGLLVHSLQCASAMVNLAECTDLTQGQTHQEAHHNKPRWILAAFLTGLLHDVGKIFDMQVLSDKLDVWNPSLESLLDWGRRLELERYHVHWCAGREHNRHAMRSLRLMYFQLLVPDCVYYLAAVSGNLLLGAMDDAITDGVGPLHALLHEAEAASIAKDAKDRRSLGLTHTRVTQPVFSCVVEAIQKLLEVDQGPWKVGMPECPFVFMTDAVYLCLTKEVLRQITETANAMGTRVPGHLEGMVRVLSQAGCLVLNQSVKPASWLWQIPAHGVKTNRSHDETPQAVRLARPALFFPKGFPTAGSAGDTDEAFGSGMVCLAPRTREDSVPRTELCAKKTDVHPAASRPVMPSAAPPAGPLIAPASATTPKSTVSTAEAPTQQTKEEGLTKDVCLRERTVAASPEEAQHFVRRLLATLAEQVHAGQGFLLEGGTLQGTQFSTLPLEEVLRLQKIDPKTAEFFMRSIATEPPFQIDFQHHVVRIRHGGD